MPISVDEHIYKHGDFWGYRIHWEIKNEAWLIDIQTPDGWESQREVFNAMSLYKAIEYAKKRINAYRILYDCTFIEFLPLAP